MTKIRQSARMEECTLRIPGVCNWNAETVVLAHIRRAWNSGMGIKPRDTHAVYACSDCHDVLDGRRRHPEDINGYLVDAILRTHDRMRAKGVI